MEPRPKPNYLIVNRQRAHAVELPKVRRFVAAVAPVLGLDDACFSIVFVNDAAMRRYNRQYRGYDKPTDVLSFRGDRPYLGDILISPESAYSQANQSRTLSFDANLHRLLLHGLLHLIGYDHETDGGQMRAIERRLRRKFQC